MAPKKRKRASLALEKKSPISMRFSPEIADAALQRARKTGLSRSQYVEQLIRQDLGRDAIDMDKRASVFG